MPSLSKHFYEYSSVEELQGLIKSIPTDEQILHIGGGSNLLFTGNYDGTVLHSAIKGISITDETDDSILVRVGSGVVWDDFVAYCCEHNWGGVENLSLIPGEVGASAVQNIGAYGSEAKDTIVLVEAVELRSGQQRMLGNAECNYAYRQSIFKQELKGKYAITYVTYKLSKKPELKLDYGNIRSVLQGKENISISDVRQAIIDIRNAKLPDPSVQGNAGSFFMNPVITEPEFNIIRSNYPDVPSYPVPDGMVKVPAGWLIEKTGWKGRSLGPAAVYEKQALVLVNKGGATGADIKRLADTIIKDVKEKFGITLSTEVNYI